MGTVKPNEVSVRSFGGEWIAPAHALQRSSPD